MGSCSRDVEARDLEVVEKFYVADHVDKWSTPWFVIYSNKDCCLPQSDEIGAFHALKQCAHFPCRLIDDDRRGIER